MYTFEKQNEIMDEILHDRLALLETIMDKEGVDCWLHLSKEYNEDPLFQALTPSRYRTARRLTILVFVMKEKKLHRIVICGRDESLEKYYTFDYSPKEETQMQALSRILEQYNPRNIAINISDDFAFTDGLSVGLYRMLEKELDSKYTSKFISSDKIGIRFLETRTEKELQYYPEIMQEAMHIINRAFSSEVIHPGITTCNEVQSFMEEEVNKLGLYTWFATDIDLQRTEGMFSGDTVIQPGDLVHCDFGIRYMNLCTDTQKLCYVRKEGEKTIPDELVQAMKRNNTFQDIVISQMVPGNTGNQVFTNSIRLGKEAGLKPMLYTHPLGFHGHGAGPIIGLFTDQNEIPVRGDLEVRDHTGWALELNTIEYLPMYGREIYMFTEESIVLVNGKVSFLSDNRTQLYMI